MLGGVLLLGRGAGCSLGVSRVAPADWRQTGYSIWSCVNAKPSVLPLSCLPSAVSPRVSNAGIHNARWAENGDRQLWCVTEKVLGLTAQWQHSLLSLLPGASPGDLSGACRTLQLTPRWQLTKSPFHSAGWIHSQVQAGPTDAGHAHWGGVSLPQSWGKS